MLSGRWRVNKWVPAWAMMVKGPRNFSESFFEGLVVRMWSYLTNTLSPTRNSGARFHRRLAEAEYRVLLLLLFNMPLTFLYYVNNSIKTQIQSRKTRTLWDFHLYNLLLFFSYIQILFRFFLDFISSSISTLFYYLSFCSRSRPFSARPLLELGCWVNDIGADGRKIGNK